MRLVVVTLLWLGGVSGRLFAAEGDHCPGVRLVPPGAVRLNATETRLVCGDTQNPVCKDIPEDQARFHLSTFLQTLGYHFPRYENEGNTLVVHLGEPTKVKTFSLEGEPPELSADRLRRVIGRTLRPGVLDEIKT